MSAAIQAHNTQPNQVFLLDNKDSFTYNLVDELAQLDCHLVLYRNTVPADFIFAKMQAAQAAGHTVLLLLSPGPGTPSEAGSMPELIRRCAGVFPMLGICLGHQALVEHYGGIVGRAGETVHGKTSLISLTEHPVFAGLPRPFPVARYHSLMATTVPDALQVIASDRHIPMAIVHEEDRALGFQFHPESILTTLGKPLLAQSLAYLTQVQASALTPQAPQQDHQQGEPS